MSKILLVEDDTEVAGWLEDWFKQENFVFEMTDNGEDALQLLEQFDFDVIILDWGLPDITGLEVCRRYRSKG
ncbi:MAG TPA: response regulator, partial [Candidatus Melainabacteria bacterium]|nr:response regulator [Candidatus Melainabacteria bacterium]